MSYICKHCGGGKNDNLQAFLQYNCSKSPTKHHEPLEGGEQAEYICKHCGSGKNKNLQAFLQYNCSKSPTKHHEPLTR